MKLLSKADAGNVIKGSRLSITSLTLGGLLAFFASASWSPAQIPVITSIQGNGKLAWTNTSNPAAIYRVEWASKPDGPWHAFTYQPINTIDAHNRTAFEVDIPMYYRVVMTTNEPPARMAWIDSGYAQMGNWAPATTTVRTNFISGFWMDTTEITKGLWDEVYHWATNNGYAFRDTAYGVQANHPATLLNWYDCVKWCNARSEMEGLVPVYIFNFFGFQVVYREDERPEVFMREGNGYRLPTSAEWEKAARGGRHNRLFPWGGDTIQHARANYHSKTDFEYDTSPTRGYHPDAGSGFYLPVGSFAPNGYGLYDMAGNAAEWCWDWHGTANSLPEIDPTGPASGINRVVEVAPQAKPFTVKSTRSAPCRLIPAEPDSVRYAVGREMCGQDAGTHCK